MGYKPSRAKHIGDLTLLIPIFPGEVGEGALPVIKNEYDAFDKNGADSCK